MSRRPRSRFLRGQRRSDSPLLCAAWAPSGPSSPKQDIAYILSGKTSNESASPSSLELFRYDFKQDILSDVIQNIAEDDSPQSIAIHPGGDGAVCSFSRSCKLYEFERGESFRIKCSDRDVVCFEGIGPQVALVFSADGSRLAAGGQDGHLRVFEWPSLSILFDQPEGCGVLSSMDISLDGAFLAAIPAGGNYCCVWEIEKSTLLTTIHNSSKAEMFGSCRFSRDGTRPFLFLTISKGGLGAIGVWDMEAWSKVGIKTISKHPITSFATSRDGKWFAIGDSAGFIHVVEVKKMQRTELVPDAHMSAVTFLEFSPNNRVYLSLASDSTLRVTKRNLAKEWKEWQIYVLLLSLIAASAVLFYIFFEHSDSFWNFPLGRNQPARPPPEAIYGSIPDFDGSIPEFDGGEFM